MHAKEIYVPWVTPEGVAVNFRGRAMGGPAGVSDGDLGEESLLLVNGRVFNLLAETGHFADLLEEDHITRLVAIDADTCPGGEVAPVSKRGSQQDVVDEEMGETDRPSRSLCTPGGQGLGKGFRRSSVDPVDDDTDVRVSSYLPAGAGLERLEGDWKVFDDG